MSRQKTEAKPSPTKPSRPKTPRSRKEAESFDDALGQRGSMERRCCRELAVSMSRFRRLHLQGSCRAGSGDGEPHRRTGAGVHDRLAETRAARQFVLDLGFSLR